MNQDNAVIGCISIVALILAIIVFVGNYNPSNHNNSSLCNQTYSYKAAGNHILYCNGHTWISEEEWNQTLAIAREQYNKGYEEGRKAIK